MKSIFLIVLILWAILLGCKTNSTLSAPQQPATTESFDKALLKEWVKDKRIVALGENTHGMGELFSLKSEIVQYLHEELDFEDLAFEGGFGSLNLAWLNRDALNDLELRDNTLFGNFKCKEIAPLFQYLKSVSANKSPLILSGFDCQNSGSVYDSHLGSIASFLEFPFDLEEEFSCYRKMFQATFEPDSTNFTAYKDRYLMALTKVMEGIKDNEKRLRSELKLSTAEIGIILQTLGSQYDAVNYTFAERMNGEYIPKGMSLRDSVMAENIKWIAEELYPNKKIVLWGHNAHIQSGPFNSLKTKWMGQFLEEAYGEDYFSIGLFAYKGSYFQHWDDQSVPFENAEVDFIEKLMSKGSLPYSYQDLSAANGPAWIHTEVRALEPENNGVVSFVPAERFDAAICILKGDVPTFE